MFFFLILIFFRVPFPFYPLMSVQDAIVLVRGRDRIMQQPVVAFFFTSCLIASLLFIGWGIYWGTFPQFSEAGLI